MFARRHIRCSVELARIHEFKVSHSSVVNVISVAFRMKCLRVLLFGGSIDYNYVLCKQILVSNKVAKKGLLSRWCP